MMTRKDYIAVSNILKEYRDVMDSVDYLDLVEDFAEYMLKDNDRFDSVRFSEACGIPEVEYPQPLPATNHVALA
jgi:hypothetical protein